MRYFVKALLAACVVAAVSAPFAAAAQEATAHVRLIHGVPGLGADVYVNGELILEGFEFGEIQNLDLPAGAHDVAVTEGGGTPDDPLASASLTTEAGLDYSVAAVTEAGTAALRVTIEDVAPVPAGMAGIVVRHYAEAVGVANIVANDATFIDNFEPFQDVAATVAAGPLSVSVVSTDGVETILGPAELELVAGRRYLVFAVGDPAVDFTLSIDVLDVGAGAPAAVLSGTGGQAAASPLPARMVGLAAGVLGLAALGTLLVRLRREGGE